MTQSARQLRMTYAEYLTYDEATVLKHEYLRGEVWAMSGGTIEHGRLAARMSRVLGNAIEGQRCEIYSSDVRVRVVETDRSTYPDLTVVCGPPQAAPDDANAIVNPIAIVEVLSHSTEQSDRGEKFAHYQRLQSLQHYILISQHERRIEVYHRVNSREWRYEVAVAGEGFSLDAVSASLRVDDIYADATAVFN